MPFATTLPKRHWDTGPGPSQGTAPGLDERVRDWVGESLPAIQAAWSSGAIDRLEPYVSPSLRDHLARELDALRRDGMVNRVEDARLEEVTLLSRSSNRLVVEVAFRARDWLADMTSGAVVDGSESVPADFRQRWQLLPTGRGQWLLEEVGPG